jgi:hypothetical protein
MLENENENFVNRSCDEALNSTYPQKPIELVHINIPVILDQLVMRKSVTRNIALSPGLNTYRPLFALEGLKDFKILKVHIISKTNLDNENYLKNIELLVNIGYNLIYSDGIQTLVQRDKADFSLKIYGIRYPDCKTKCFSNDCAFSATEPNCKSNVSIKIDCIAEPFGEIICPCTGALIVDIGVFFIIKCECVTQIKLPLLGCCCDLKQEGCLNHESELLS